MEWAHPGGQSPRPPPAGKVVGEGTLPELVSRLFGGRRTVTLTLDRVPASTLPGLELKPEGRSGTALLADAVEELPALLARVRACGLERELRE